MSINSQYIVLFKNIRDQVGPAVFARQMYQNNPTKFMSKFADGTKRPYGYLFIDLKRNTPEEDRFKAGILNEDEPSIAEYKRKIGGNLKEVGYNSADTYL